MVVVLTAPMPTSRTPSFPVASAIFEGFFTTAHYIIVPMRDWRRAGAAARVTQQNVMAWFRNSTTEPLTVAMSGIKLGDRLLVVGCSDPALIAGAGIKAGLTGRACAVDTDAARVAQTARTVEQNGALVETAAVQWSALPYASGDFDVVILRDVLGGAGPADQQAIAGESLRVLRPGGRAVVIETSGTTSLAGLVSRPVHAAFFAAGGATPLLTTAGFAGVRTLGESGGLAFVEGIKRNS
jgi:SAM-dependent methyltransferase